MRFEYEGSTYLIEFMRKNKTVRVGVNASGDDVWGISRFPYTTVIIWKLIPNSELRELVRTATVGCHHGDEYSPEKGRVNALRLVTKTLEKPFYTKMWQAYTGRFKN